MFYRINDFAFARSAKQAAGFYMFHSVVAVLGMLTALLVYGFVFGDESFFSADVKDEAYLAFIYLGIAYIGYLTYRILAAKNRLQDLGSLLAGVFGVIAAFKGLIVGMLVVSCLSILLPRAENKKGGLYGN